MKINVGQSTLRDNACRNCHYFKPRHLSCVKEILSQGATPSRRIN
jgi:hypothetical protein